MRDRTASTGRVPSHPVTFHIVNHHYGATLLRPTRRERLRGWWHAHRWPLLRKLLPWLEVLAFVVALNLLKAGADALADWVSAL